MGARNFLLLLNGYTTCTTMTTPAANYIRKVAIVGATGNAGSYMTKALLATGKLAVTAITRTESTAIMPAGVQVAKVDYSDPASLVAALQGQDALVITMSGRAPPDSDAKLITAAADAGVKWVLPNEFAPDMADEVLGNEMHIGAPKRQHRELIEKLGKSSYVAVSCGFWYEWSLALTVAYGFDFGKRTVTMFDDGETKICTTTWPQLGLAVAKLLSLKIEPDGPDDKEPCLEMFRDKFMYMTSFVISQRDMFESVLRVTGTSEADWTITYVPSLERYNNSVAVMATDRTAFVRQMCTRLFFQDDRGNTEKTRGLSNKLLGLPRDEDLDKFTKLAIERQQMLEKIGMNMV
ncbi:uncharacterized protein V1518DRAFT_424005 [Limtongia smithiae]|uniref:uncharacterized protein n=1 Tax=Limtongia smithiae TaxID=1125753 RepID=UPI0034CE1FB4